MFILQVKLVIIEIEKAVQIAENCNNATSDNAVRLWNQFDDVTL